MPGPPPKKGARYGAGRSGWVQLPKSGRKRPAPEFPWGVTPRGWDELWSLPQALMWERDNALDVVARYASLRALVQNPQSLEDVNAAALSEVRQLEDRLGLSPMAMKRMQWEISEAVQDDDEAPVSSAEVVNISDRYKAL